MRNGARVFGLLLLGASALPLHAQADEGRDAFTRACARCHAATAVPEVAEASANTQSSPARRPSVDVRPGTPPDLGRIAASRSFEALSLWVAGPHRVNPDTGCDTRILEEHERTALLAYLQTLARPATASRDAELERNLSRSLKARGVRTDELPQPEPRQAPPGGKR